MNVFASLTPAQAALYEAVTNDILNQIDQAKAGFGPVPRGIIFKVCVWPCVCASCLCRFACVCACVHVLCVCVRVCVRG